MRLMNARIKALESEGEIHRIDIVQKAASEGEAG
jgi:hypothetical protein